MSIEMADGTFTPPELFNDELLDRFKMLAESGDAIAFHVGTEKDLDAKADKAKLKAEMKDLQKRIEMLEKRETGPIKFPTFDDIKKYASD